MVEERALSDTQDWLHLLELRLDDMDSRMKKVDKEVCRSIIVRKLTLFTILETGATARTVEAAAGHRK